MENDVTETVIMEQEVSFIVEEESGHDTDTVTKVGEAVYSTTEKSRALAIASKVLEAQGMTTDANRRSIRLTQKEHTLERSKYLIRN